MAIANEIWCNDDEGATYYAVIWRKSNDQLCIVAGDTSEAWVDANIGNYDVPLTGHDGDYYSADFPTAITTEGVYRITIFKQAGGSPHADNDTSEFQGELYWNGSEEVNIYTVNQTSTSVTNIYDESTPPPVTVIND